MRRQSIQRNLLAAIALNTTLCLQCKFNPDHLSVIRARRVAIGDDLRRVIDVFGTTADFDGYGPGWYDLHYPEGVSITIDESKRVHAIERAGKTYPSTEKSGGD
jgi:hypothetical protein